jgi:RNA polymerase sigma-70 factor (ECF subfamily)
MEETWGVRRLMTRDFLIHDLIEDVMDGTGPEVIEACQRGEQDAFAALFEAHRDRVYSIALRYAGNRTAAMDIAQDAFLKLLSGIQEFRGEARFETWLFRVVVNSCMDYRRGLRRALPFAAGMLDALGTGRDSVLHSLMRSETCENVQQGIAALPPQQRIVVVLRYTEGLAYEDIAAAVGCSVGTVASRLSRAHKTLERRLGHLRK